jgi:hypothetical protein
MVREAFRCLHCGLRVQPHRSNSGLRAGAWLSGRPDPNPHGYCFGYQDGAASGFGRMPSTSTGCHVSGQTSESYCRSYDCCYLDSVSSAIHRVGLQHVRVGTRLAVVGISDHYRHGQHLEIISPTGRRENWGKYLPSRALLSPIPGERFQESRSRAASLESSLAFAGGKAWE